MADIPVYELFGSNVGVKGSGASARHHIRELMQDVLHGQLDLSGIFTETLPLSEIAKGYADMDERREISVVGMSDAPIIKTGTASTLKTSAGRTIPQLHVINGSVACAPSG